MTAPDLTAASSSSVVVGAAVTLDLSYHMATALRDSGTMNILPSTLDPSTATWLKPSSLPSSAVVRSASAPASACENRLSFGAMYMSGPPPARTSVCHLVKMSLNGCSTTLTLRSLLAAVMAPRVFMKAPVSPPPEP